MDALDDLSRRLYFFWLTNDRWVAFEFAKQFNMRLDTELVYRELDLTSVDE